MADRWSYELASHPDGGGRFLISVHHYRNPGFATTVQELEFDTFKDAAKWLKEELNA